MIIANMASFPGRKNILPIILERILPQVDLINLCLNNYEKIPSFLKHDKINTYIPKQDYRDVGKFIISDFDSDDDIFYLDDDIIYPKDYVDTLCAARTQYSSLQPVVGLHGVIYPDVYDGTVGNRVVFAFRKALNNPRVVNQLGTGTVHCKGYQAPSLNFMAGSERYVDVRFAKYAMYNQWPMICISRKDLWMDEIQQEESIFSTFTAAWPSVVVRECQTISGYAALNPNIVLKVESGKY